MDDQRNERSVQFQHKRELLLSGATSLVNLHGLKGTTLADVAEYAALSLKSVRYYFTRKEDLIDACFARAFAAYDTLIDHASAGRTATERVCRLIDAWMDLYAQIRRGEHPPILNFGHVTAVDERHDQPARVAYRRMFRRIGQLVAGDEKEPVPRESLAIRGHFVLSQLLWAVVWIGRYDVDHLPRVGHHMQRILCHGLLAEGESWAPIETPIATHDAQGDPRDEAFLRAATVLINQQGYRGASVEKIAAELSKTKGAFYHRLDTKDHLVEGCFLRTFDVMRRAQQDAEQTSARASVRLATLSAQLTLYQLSSDGPLLRTSALAAVPLSIKESMKLHLDAITQRIYDLLMDGILEQSIRPVDAWIGAQMINGTINSCAELRLWVPELNGPRATQEYTRPLFEGFLTP